jgi:hypothetical protein
LGRKTGGPHLEEVVEELVIGDVSLLSDKVEELIHFHNTL